MTARWRGGDFLKRLCPPLKVLRPLARRSSAQASRYLHLAIPACPCCDVSRRGERWLTMGRQGCQNFSGERYGLATRIARSPWRDALYGARSGNLFIEAVAVSYDAASWERRFLAQWPPGSDAHRSYYTRMVNGPNY